MEACQAPVQGGDEGPDRFSNRGELDLSDARWKTFYERMSAAGVIVLSEPS